MMAFSECNHKDEVLLTVDKEAVRQCKTCGQIRKLVSETGRYAVIKLGRVNGALVQPDPEYRLALTASESLELQDGQTKEQPSRVKSLVEKAAGVEVRVEDGQKIEAAQEPPSQENHEKVLTRHQLYRKNKRAMIDDLFILNREEFLRKWGVKHQIISHLKSDSYYKEKVGHIPAQELGQPKKRHKPGPKPATHREILPVFPPFNESWGDSVKVAWLEAYGKLKTAA